MSSFTFTLNFPNGNVQTYPDGATMKAAAKAMGGEAVAVILLVQIKFMLFLRKNKRANN